MARNQCWSRSNGCCLMGCDMGVKSLIKQAWADPVGSKVIATGILSLLAIVATGFKAIRDPLFTAIATSLTWLCAETRVPNAVLLLGVFAVGIAASKAVMQARRVPQAMWRTYAEDVFDGIKWRWKVGSDATIYRLRPFCPQCDCEMQYSQLGQYDAAPSLGLHCIQCEYGVVSKANNPDDLEDRVRRLVGMQLRKRGAPTT
jgi:hypothetical protein